jgi:hypothetical protein
MTENIKDRTPKTKKLYSKTDDNIKIGDVTNDELEGSKQLEKIPSSFTNPPLEMVGNRENSIWVKIKAIPIYSLTNNARAVNSITSNNDYMKSHEQLAEVVPDGKIYSFNFLSPPDLMEQISHEWQPYESIASEIAGIYAKFGISLSEEIKGLHPTFKQETFLKMVGYGVRSTLSAAGQILSSPDKLSEFMAQIRGFGANAVKSGYVANYRVDTPLQYKGSERRTFDLVFNLINTDKNKNHENVVLPVKLLQMLSTPAYPRSKNNGTVDDNFNVDIILPYLFTINTDPGDLITVDLAVLKSVNPTWRGPYIDGYPSRCELRLSFTEYRPLEQSVFYGRKQKMITTERDNRQQAWRDEFDIRNPQNKGK